MCEPVTRETVRVSFDIPGIDLGHALALARREGITTRQLYARAVAEYLINHGDPEWFAEEWPVGASTGAGVPSPRVPS